MFRPHCDRCDDLSCNDTLDRDLENSFIEEAGEKPKSGLLRSAWEHSFMVWCRAWKTALKRKSNGL